MYDYVLIIRMVKNKTGRSMITCSCMAVFFLIVLYLQSNSVQKPYSRILMEAFPAVIHLPGYNFLSDEIFTPQNNIFLTQYQLHYCKIDKNAGSVFQALTCYLWNSEKYHDLFTNGAWTPGLYKPNSKTNTDCVSQSASGILRNATLAAAKTINFFQNRSIIHLAIIRDPLERFVSAWLDVCLTGYSGTSEHCLGCGEDLGCFLVQNYWLVRRLAKQLPMFKSNRDYFPNISKEINANKRFVRRWETHFYPQAWHCDFETNLDSYQLIAHLRERRLFARNVLEILKERGVAESKLAVIGDTLKRKSTTHTTNSTRAQHVAAQIKQNPLLRHVFLATYRADYDMFGFGLPS